jgi:hypothetical protein
MWAVIDKESKIVVGIFPPNVSQDEMLKEASGKILIQMTPDNSPGYINGTYENGKFYPPKELVNG